ncbi:MAG: hypothetical protein CVV24_03595 [Ignavibacteriae bacterium HGW-Ignavibacteriae-3]|nr:MAG: hypothetical protein CVV24_03595 [Ignavibacteriae bacterium HGW-Ignavibacteriae-3]
MKKSLIYKLPFLFVCGYLGLYFIVDILAIMFNSHVGETLALIASNFRHTAFTEEAVGIPGKWHYQAFLNYFSTATLLFSFIYSFYNLWQLTRNLSRSKLIISENGYLLTRLALVLIMYMTHLKILRIGCLLTDSSFKIEILIGGILGLIFNLQIIIGTLIFTIGKVMIYASEIKQENDLTV